MSKCFLMFHDERAQNHTTVVWSMKATEFSCKMFAVINACICVGLKMHFKTKEAAWKMRQTQSKNPSELSTFVFLPGAALSWTARKWVYCRHHKVALSWTPRAGRLLTEIHLGWGWVHSGKRWGGQWDRMDCRLEGFGRPADLLNTHFREQTFSLELGVCVGGGLATHHISPV